MKKSLFLLLILLFLPSFLLAKTAEDDRRIEEEKRKSLAPTEIEILRKKPAILEPREPVGLDYFRELLSKDIALNSDLSKAIAVLLGIEDAQPNFDSQLSFFKQDGILSQKMAAEFYPQAPLRKGVAAYIFCKALKIKGGIWLRLLGMNQRYALKELVFEEIMAAGNVNDIVSGKELVISLTKAIEYMTAETK